MKKVLVLSLILLAVGLFAQAPYGVVVRFIDGCTGLDYTDISEIQFEVELEPGSGDIQVGPSALCTVSFADIGAGIPQSFVQFDLANFANPYTQASNIRVSIWDGISAPSTVIYNKAIHLDPAGGFMGWAAWFGVGGDPIVIWPDVPTPVTLSEFAAAVFQNQFVEISWTTESESGNQGFNIYRSLSDDPATSTQLNFNLIPGAGSSSEPIEYSFMDEGVENYTTYWYWLESVSYDETALHGPSTLTIEFTDDPIPEIIVPTELFGNYPNPFNPATFISFNVKENESATLSIFNTKGQLVMNRTFHAGFYNYNWQADSNPSGVYLYKLQSESYKSVKKMLLLK